MTVTVLLSPLGLAGTVDQAPPNFVSLLSPILTHTLSFSNQYLDLVPLDYTLGASAKFDESNTIRLEGAHGTEVVRSFCFTDETQGAVLTAGEDGRIKAWRVDTQPGRAKGEPKGEAADNDDNREDGQSDVGKGKRKNARFKPY